MDVLDHTHPLSVLIVEDDVDYAALVREQLERNPELPVVVDHAASLVEALDRFASNEFAAVLLDLGLPDEEGLRTVRRVTDVAGRSAVVVMTALDEQHVAIEAIKLGAQEYVLKTDLTQALLLRTLRYAVERKRLLEELEHAREREESQREMRRLERLAAEPRASVTARMFGDGPLHERSQERYESIRQEYRRILDQALVERAYRKPAAVNEDLRSLAEVLGFLHAGPRDVVRLHTEVMKATLNEVGSDRRDAYLQEGRVLGLELMGYLAGYYRARVPFGRADVKEGS